jgi:hypothetical protein
MYLKHIQGCSQKICPIVKLVYILTAEFSAIHPFNRLLDQFPTACLGMGTSYICNHSPWLLGIFLVSFLGY